MKRLLVLCICVFVYLCICVFVYLCIVFALTRLPSCAYCDIYTQLIFAVVADTFSQLV